LLTYPMKFGNICNNSRRIARTVHHICSESNIYRNDSIDKELKINKSGMVN
jgi:hypothetical protein